MASSVTPAERKALIDLILDVSYEKKEVTLASGQKSNMYLDLRQTLMRPMGVDIAGRLTLELLKAGPPIQAIGGMAVGAVPYVSAILGAAARDPESTDLLGFFVRKEVKKHGMAKQIEGAFEEGWTVSLVEDTTTTGGSTLQALDLVEAAGGKVESVYCLVDRGAGAIEAFAERGVTLTPVFPLSELGLA